MIQVNLQEAFKYIIVILKVIGVWSYQKEIWYKLYKILITCGLILNNLSMMIYFALHIHQDDALEALYVIPAFVQAFIKYLMFQKNFPQILETMDILKIESCQPRNEAQKKIIDETIGLGKMSLKVFGGIVFFLCFVYAVRPLTNEEKNLSQLAWMPFDYKQPVVFEAVHTFLTLCFIHASFCNVSMDCFVCISMAQIAAQCEIIGDTLRNIREMAQDQRCGMRQVLAECVEHYNLALKYAKLLGNTYKEIVMAQFVCSVLNICTTMYLLSLAEPASPKFVEYFLYQSAVSCEIFIYCFYGDLIIEKSQGVFHATYESQWYDSSKEFKSDLYTFMGRVQKPIVFYAWNIFPINMDTYKGIMGKSWSFFMALKNMQNIQSHYIRA